MFYFEIYGSMKYIFMIIKYNRIIYTNFLGLVNTIPPILEVKWNIKSFRSFSIHPCKVFGKGCKGAALPLKFLDLVSILPKPTVTFTNLPAVKPNSFANVAGPCFFGCFAKRVYVFLDIFQNIYVAEDMTLFCL